MGWPEKVQAATKALNEGIDGVEQFIQKIVDTKIKKIDDYGKKITAYFDADFKLIEAACLWLIWANEEQMKGIISERGPEPLIWEAMASPSEFNPKMLEYITERMKVTGFIKGNPNPKLFSIKNENDTYFTPSDLVLSASEASQIRSKINSVGTNQFQKFITFLQDKIYYNKCDQYLLDYDAAFARWRKINVPEPQLILTYSLPLKQKALIWDLKIDILVDRRNNALKQANRDVKADFSAKKILAYSLDRRWSEQKQDPIDLGDVLEICELYSQVDELYAQIEKLEKEMPKGTEECIEGVESPLEKAYKQIDEKESQIQKLYEKIRAQEHELLKGGK